MSKVSRCDSCGGIAAQGEESTWIRMGYRTEPENQVSEMFRGLLGQNDPNQILLEFCSPRCVMVRCMVMETEPQWTR